MLPTPWTVVFGMSSLDLLPLLTEQSATRFLIYFKVVLHHVFMHDVLLNR